MYDHQHVQLVASSLARLDMVGTLADGGRVGKQRSDHLEHRVTSLVVGYAWVSEQVEPDNMAERQTDGKRSRPVRLAQHPWLLDQHTCNLLGRK